MPDEPISPLFVWRSDLGCEDYVGYPEDRDGTNLCLWCGNRAKEASCRRCTRWNEEDNATAAGPVVDHRHELGGRLSPDAVREYFDVHCPDGLSLGTRARLYTTWTRALAAYAAARFDIQWHVIEGYATTRSEVAPKVVLAHLAATLVNVPVVPKAN